MTDESYIRNIEEYRKAKDQRMIANPRNWLALIGLYWLEEGENRLGAEASGKTILPKLSQTNTTIIRLEQGMVTLAGNGMSGLKMNGQIPEERPLRTDQDDEPDVLEVGTLLMMIIKRGKYTLLRVWDSEADAVLQFKGLHYYPIQPEYCISAGFKRYDPPKTRMTFDAIGTELETAYAGQVQFILNGVECHLEAEEDGDDLLINFTDPTREDTTYPAGRYLVVPKPENDQVMLDFNLASNWPCAYTAYATCPLPAPENSLPVRIEAGELKYCD